MLHQLSLISKSVLQTVDDWIWPLPPRPQKKHFNGVSMFSSTWRATGLPHRIAKAAVKEWGPMIAHMCFTKMPTRCIRTRWGSTDSVEAKFKLCQPYLEPVLRRVFAKELAQRDKRAAKAAAAALAAAGAPADGGPLPLPDIGPAPKRAQRPGEDIENAFRDEEKAKRCSVVDLAGNRSFCAQVVISLVAKSEIQKLMIWEQARVRDFNKAKKKYETDGRVYLGPTPLSLLVCHHAKEVDANIDGLLADGSLTDSRRWGPVWALLPDALHASARQLIVTAVLVVKCSFKLRILDKASASVVFLLASAGVCARARRCSS
eukprot:7329361-Pyramimonas_sp.AAC.1